MAVAHAANSKVGRKMQQGRLTAALSFVRVLLQTR